MDVLHKQILRLRTQGILDDPVPASTIFVRSEDMNAWCATETPSVWSTAYSVWSLIETGYDGPETATVGNGCRWLIAEASPEGGWGYNLCPETPATVYLTSLAIKALVHCIRTPATYGLTSADVAEAHKRISDGVAFILRCRCADSKAPVPVFQARAYSHGYQDAWDLVSTVWAYQIVLEHGKRAERATVEGSSEALFDYLFEAIGSTNERMPIAFVDEALTKYQRSKKYMYYQPSLLINLLKIGLSPLHPLSFSLLSWLKSTIRPNGATSDYHPTNATSFATALAVQTIHAWGAAVSRSVDAVQDNSRAACIELPKMRTDLQEAEKELEEAHDKANSLARREIVLITTIVVVAVLRPAPSLPLPYCSSTSQI